MLYVSEGVLEQLRSACSSKLAMLCRFAIPDCEHVAGHDHPGLAQAPLSAALQGASGSGCVELCPIVIGRMVPRMVLKLGVHAHAGVHCAIPDCEHVAGHDHTAAAHAPFPTSL